MKGYTRAQQNYIHNLYNQVIDKIEESGLTVICGIHKDDLYREFRNGIYLNKQGKYNPQQVIDGLKESRYDFSKLQFVADNATIYTKIEVVEVVETQVVEVVETQVVEVVEVVETVEVVEVVETQVVEVVEVVETQNNVVEVVETQVETLSFPTIQSFLENARSIEECENGDLVVRPQGRVLLTADKEFCAKYLASKMFGEESKAIAKKLVKLNIADKSYEFVELVIESEPEPEPEFKTTYATSAEYFDLLVKSETYEREGVIWSENKKQTKDEYPAFFVDYLKDGRVHCSRPYNSDWNPVCDYITMQYGKRYKIVGKVYMNIGASLNMQYLVLEEELI